MIFWFFLVYICCCNLDPNVTAISSSNASTYYGVDLPGKRFFKPCGVSPIEYPRGWCISPENIIHYHRARYWSRNIQSPSPSFPILNRPTFQWLRVVEYHCPWKIFSPICPRNVHLAPPRYSTPQIPARVSQSLSRYPGDWRIDSRGTCTLARCVRVRLARWPLATAQWDKTQDSLSWSRRLTRSSHVQLWGHKTHVVNSKQLPNMMCHLHPWDSSHTRTAVRTVRRCLRVVLLCSDSPS
jgi:hypothetical protein